MSKPLDWARVPAGNLSQRRTQANLAVWRSTHSTRGRVITARKDGDAILYEAWQDMSTLSVEYPSVEVQFARIRGGSATAYGVPSVRDALGVPAILRGVTLIATVTGSLPMRALRSQVETKPEDRPSLIVRPDPARTPFAFTRDTAWNLARYGEAWWYVSARDRDDKATALYNVHDPREVQVEANDDDPARPHITWRRLSTRDGSLRRDNLQQITLTLDDSGLRGWGPLQWCGAATSVAVEAQRWAANFYAAGGYPSYLIRSAVPLGGGDDGWSNDDQVEAGIVSEAERLKAQWMETAPNTPKVVDPAIEDVKVLDVPMASAQALESRNMQNGEAARMLGIPGVLLEFVQSGSSLTYQNIETVFTQWLRTGLRPQYLVPIEQTMSDLLARSTSAEFDTEQLELPSLKTRFETYEIGIRSGIVDTDWAQGKEGIRPGQVEHAAVPITSIRPPIPRLMARGIRCTGEHPDRPGHPCGKLLSTSGAFVGRCPRCKTEVNAA
jgi:HK97 family phage portal protein